MLLNLGLALALSPSKAVEKPATVWEIYALSIVPLHPSVQSMASSLLFSKYRLVIEAVPPKNSTPSSSPFITAMFSKVVPEPTA